jgi:hypothetical protein
MYIIAWLDCGFTDKHQPIDMRVMSRRENPKVGNKRKEVHPVLTYFCNKASGDFDKYPPFQMIILID